MERQMAIEAYRRVKAVEKLASANLMLELERKSGMPGLTPHLLHNWSIGERPVHPNLVPVKRWHDWAQRRVWDETQRLETAFAKHF